MRIVLWESTDKGSKVIEKVNDIAINDKVVVVLDDNELEYISFDKIRYIETKSHIINFEKR